MQSHYTIKDYNGSLTFFRDGVPVFPLFFWQSRIEAKEAKAFKDAGIDIYSFFCTYHNYEHPWWIGENSYDFSWIDSGIRDLLRVNPDAFCIPRLFVSAPEWWIEKNPEEACGFGAGGEWTRYDEAWQGTKHESFASELWRQEGGEAFRQLIRHMLKQDYAEQIIGIHVANGITGEWHLWSPCSCPDNGNAMQQRYGKDIPALDKREPAYYKLLNAVTVEAIDHFCRIVKEESSFLTCVFYGYTPDIDWYLEGDHRAAAALHRLESVDMVSAPHSYERRLPGEDAYFRNYPGSLALHNKLFIDEGDDRTFLVSRSNGAPYDNISSLQDSLNILQREFGNMLTHNIAMWFMDLIGGTFRDDRIMAEIRKLKKWGDYSIATGLSRRRESEVAVISSLESEFYLPRRASRGNNISSLLYVDQIGELCRTGAPFDSYLIEDIFSPKIEEYKVIICLDCMHLSDEQFSRLKELQCDNRLFIWFYAPGMFNGENASFKRMEELTGFRLKSIEAGRLRAVWNGTSFGRDELQVPVYYPLNGKALAHFENSSNTAVAYKRCEDWQSVYCAASSLSAKLLTRLYRQSGVHIYSETGDVLSAAEASVMLHSNSKGNKKIVLKRPVKATEIVSGKCYGEQVSKLEFEMDYGETVIFILE